MKKLITLLLVLTGCVCTVSADSHIIYLNPGWTNNDWAKDGARFALYMYNSSNASLNAWVDFIPMSYVESGDKGTRRVYGAIFSSGEDNYDKIILCRMNGSTSENNWDNRWDEAPALSAPTSDVCYDFTGWGADPSFGDEANINTYAKKSVSFVVAADKEIVTNNEDWQALSTNNVMTSNGDFTYSFSISNKMVVPSSYGYKIVFSPNGWWCGDPSNSGNDFPAPISYEGYYDINYTFDYTTGVATITSVRNEDITITYNLAQWKGKDTYTGWDSNDMTITNGSIASWGIKNQTLTTTENSIKYKIVRREWTKGTEEATKEDWLGNITVDDEWLFAYTPTEAGSFDVYYNYDISTGTSSVVVYRTTNEYYYMGGSTSGNSWALGSQLTETGADTGIFEITLTGDGTNEYTFAIAPVYALDGTEGNYTKPASSDKWALMIHPQSATTISSFVKYEGSSKQANSEDNWTMSFNGNVTFRYNSNDNTWSVVPYRTATIGSAEYITYSNGEKCTVSGAEKIYVITNNNTNTVHAEEMDASTVWPANEGMILKGSNGTNVTIKAVASDATATTIGTNYLVGSGNSTASITAGDGIYIFWWDGSNASSVGFYKANNGTLGAHKAYLNLGRAFNAHEFLAFDFGDEGDTTGIQQLDAMNHHVDGYFNLAGQRVAQPTKGLYIVNGKKVVIK